MSIRRKKSICLSNNKLQIVIKPIDDLKKYANNPRINTEAVEAVKNSIQNFGFLVPIVVDKNNEIIAGHTRYDAAIKLDLKEVPCVVADSLTEKQIRAFRVVDNKVSEIADWDSNLLSQELAALSDFSFVEFGWDKDELDECISNLSQSDQLSSRGVNTKSTSTGSRAPNRIRLSIGEFVIFVPQDAYRRWAGEVRAECDYVESVIHQMVKDRLGITPYEDAQ